MTRERARNVPASVKQRLLNLARERGLELQYLLNRYASERLLFRMSRSPHARRFVLKGATLFSIWAGTPDRPTWDVDLLGRGSNQPADLEAVFRELCTLAVDDDDGLVFAPASVTSEGIRKSEEYQGVRVRLQATLGTARIPLQVDIGFGDAVTPAARTMTLPTLLNHPAPRLRVYPRETVIAEKFEAMVALGAGNTRLKDFYDVWILSRHFAFEQTGLAAAITATFQRRGMPLPAGVPFALSDDFAKAPDKRQQWDAFTRRVAAEPTGELSAVLEALRAFLLPPLAAARAPGGPDRRWPAGGPWLD